MDKKTKTIVCVDPGFRNLAWARLCVTPRTGAINLESVHHLDLGPVPASQTRVFNAVWPAIANEDVFKGADIAVIENQVMGMYHSKPLNVALMYTLASAAMAQGVSEVVFMSSRFKFKIYKNLLTPTERKLPTKTKASKLCKTLFVLHKWNNDVLYKDISKTNRIHVEDAIGLGCAVAKDMFN